MYCATPDGTTLKNSNHEKKISSLALKVTIILHDFRWFGGGATTFSLYTLHPYSYAVY